MPEPIKPFFEAHVQLAYEMAGDITPEEYLRRIADRIREYAGLQGVMAGLADKMAITILGHVSPVIEDMSLRMKADELATAFGALPGHAEFLASVPAEFPDLLLVKAKLCARFMYLRGLLLSLPDATEGDLTLTACPKLFAEVARLAIHEFSGEYDDPLAHAVLRLVDCILSPLPAGTVLEPEASEELRWCIGRNFLMVDNEAFNAFRGVLGKCYLTAADAAKNAPKWVQAPLRSDKLRLALYINEVKIAGIRGVELALRNETICDVFGDMVLDDEQIMLASGVLAQLRGTFEIQSRLTAFFNASMDALVICSTIAECNAAQGWAVSWSNGTELHPRHLICQLRAGHMRDSPDSQDFARQLFDSVAVFWRASCHFPGVSLRLILSFADQPHAREQSFGE